MPSPAAALHFDTEFDPQYGVPVGIAPGIVRVTAPNSGPFTFTGTNSYVLGDTELAIVDPGPDADSHLDALLRCIGGRPVAAIVLTHTHRDHTALVRRLAHKVAAPVWFEGRHRNSRPRKPFEINLLSRSCDWDLLPDRRIADGAELAFGSVQVKALATPGHCRNHMSFGIVGTPYILTGDHVMGWNSTLVATPDGSMSDYFDSLDKLIWAPWTYYLPAHGGPIARGREYARGLKGHREMRNGQILEALRGGPLTPRQLRDRIYPGLPAANLRAAGMTLRAHVEYLEARGDLSTVWGLTGGRVRLAR